MGAADTPVTSEIVPTNPMLRKGWPRNGWYTVWVMGTREHGDVGLENSSQVISRVIHRIHACVLARVSRILMLVDVSVCVTLCVKPVRGCWSRNPR